MLSGLISRICSTNFTNSFKEVLSFHTPDKNVYHGSVRMRCPQCKCQDDKVVDSRTAKEGAAVRRRRECLNCGHRFTTYEEIIQAELSVVKKDGTRQEFDREKIRNGINKACWKRKITTEEQDVLIEKVIAGIEADYDSEVPSEEIGVRVMKGLKKLDEVAYVRFASVYREFRDIEQFINEIRLISKNGAKPKPGKPSTEAEE